MTGELCAEKRIGNISLLVYPIEGGWWVDVRVNGFTIGATAQDNLDLFEAVKQVMGEREAEKGGWPKLEVKHGDTG